MGLKERVTRRFLKELRRAGVKRSDVILVPVDSSVQSYAALKILGEVEEGYDTVLRALLLEPLPGCFDAVLRRYGYDVVPLYSRRAAGLEGAMGIECGYALVVMPLSADDVAVALLEGALGMDWRLFRVDARCRVAYPLAGTTLEELTRLYGGCGVPRVRQGEGCDVLGRLRGRVTVTALSKVFMRLRGVFGCEAGCLHY